MIIDAHTHIRKEDVKNGILSFLEREKILSLVSGGNPEECDFVEKIAEKSHFVIPTFGIHPWQADKFKIEDMKEYLENCKVIGEIGMDRVWCDVDLDKQEDIFRQQLFIAERRMVPVILHTKGAEKEIADIIFDFTMPVLVHWYSSTEHLEKFIERDCYFTVGPDFAKNEAVRQVVEKVGLDRLFVETDGLSAIDWVFESGLDFENLPKSLKNTIAYISKVKNISEEKVKKVILNNLESYGKNLWTSH